MKNITGFLIFFLLFSCFSIDSFSQTEKGIHWLSFEQAIEANSKKPKKVFVDLYTDWCGWCKKLDQTTFADPAVIKYMNENYYSVKLNAEKKDTIRFSGHNFVVPPGAKTHQMATALMQNKLSGYPSSCFLNEKSEIIYNSSGYIETTQFLTMVKFFAEDIYLKKSWEEYKNNQPKNTE